MDRLRDLRELLKARPLEAVPIRPVRDLVEGAIAGEGTTVWFGDGGTGKSILALIAACSVSTGLDSFARSTFQGPVVWLDFESRATATSRRVNQLLGTGVQSNIEYVPGSAPIWARRTVSEFVELSRPALVVLDSAARAVQGQTMDPASVARFYDTVDGFGCPVLVLAHVNREGDGHKPFGLNAWHDGARATYSIRKTRAPGHVIELRQRKANDGPGNDDPVRVEVRYEADRIYANRLDFRGSVSETFSAQAVAAAVISIYEETVAPVTFREIQNQFAIGRTEVHRRLAEAVATGLIQTNGLGGRARAYLPPQRGGNGSDRTFR